MDASRGGSEYSMHYRAVSGEPPGEEASQVGSESVMLNSKAAFDEVQSWFKNRPASQQASAMETGKATREIALKCLPGPVEAPGLLEERDIKVSGQAKRQNGLPSAISNSRSPFAWGLFMRTGPSDLGTRWSSGRLHCVRDGIRFPNRNSLELTFELEPGTEVLLERYRSEVQTRCTPETWLNGEVDWSKWDLLPSRPRQEQVEKDDQLRATDGGKESSTGPETSVPQAEEVSDETKSVSHMRRSKEGSE